MRCSKQCYWGFVALKLQVSFLCWTATVNFYTLLIIFRLYFLICLYLHFSLLCIATAAQQFPSGWIKLDLLLSYLNWSAAENQGDNPDFKNERPSGNNHIQTQRYSSRSAFVLIRCIMKFPVFCGLVACRNVIEAVWSHLQTMTLTFRRTVEAPRQERVSNKTI